MMIALMALWGAVVWRVRGGGLGDAFGWKLGGTTVTRLLTGLALAAPVAALTRNWWALALAPAIWAGLSVAGWAAFMAYGQDCNRHLAGSPFDWFDRELGIPTASQWADAIAWLQAGCVAMLPAALVLLALHLGWLWMLLPALSFAPVYWIADTLGARGWLPLWRRFVPTEETWAELAMGGVIGAALWLAARGAGAL